MKNIIVLMLCMISCNLKSTDEFPIVRESNESIKPYVENPRYWEYKEEPILLLGGSFEDNMFQFPNLYYDTDKYDYPTGMTTWTLEEHLDVLIDCGGNYLRNTMSSRNPGNRFAFKKISGTPGDNKPTDTYDLDQWDDEYWNRFETFLQECFNRDIIVQIEIWDRFDFFLSDSETGGTAQYIGKDNTGWESNPYNPLRNVNYTAAESGLPEDVDYRPTEHGPSPHPFFHSVPELSEHENACEPIVLYYQEKFVEKMLSISLKYPNILYCINNETPEYLEWGAYWIKFIRDKAAEASKTVYCSDMRRSSNFAEKGHPEIMEDEFYDFFEASQSTAKDGDDHYDALIYARNRIKEHGGKIKPINNVKIYGGTIGWSGGGAEGIRRMWRMIFAGGASSRFHRPVYTQYYSGIGLNDDAQRCIESLRMFTDAMNVFRCEPRNDLLINRADNEAYCLAEEGRQYSVFFNNGGSVDLDLSESSGELEIKWLDIEKSEWGYTATITGGGTHTLSSPSSGQWAVLIKK